MPIYDEEDGDVIPRLVTDIQASVIDALADEFGSGVRNDADPIRKFAEAFFTTPLSQLEEEVLNLFSQHDPRKATGQYLDGNLWPIVTRRQAGAAAGTVEGSLKAIPTTPSPFFSAGQLTFTDGVGNSYTTNTDNDPPAKLEFSTTTGTASENIGGANTRIAQKISFTKGEFPAAVTLLANEVSGTPVYDVTIQTDDSGEPSGTVVGTLQNTNAAFTDGVFSPMFFAPADVIETTGDYWLVVEITGGESTLDGALSGTADQVKLYSGASWVNSSNVYNLQYDIHEGFQFSVIANQLGSQSNIDSSSINSNTASTTLANTRFNNNVAAGFTNQAVITAGQDRETDQQLLTRARGQKAARTTASTPGLLQTLESVGSLIGISAVDVEENDSLDWGTGDEHLNKSSATGTPGEAIDDTPYEGIAQKLVLTERRSISQITAEFTAASTFNFDLKIEGDSSGPDGTALLTQNYTVNASGSEVFDITKPIFLDPGTYWVVFSRISGSATIDGETGSGDDAVRRNDAGWTDSAVDNLAIAVYGGLPGRSFRPYVRGGDDDAIAELIYASKPSGGYSDGAETGVAEDPTGADVDVHFERIVDENMVVRVDLTVNQFYSGGEDTIRNIIVEEIGGTNTEGKFAKSLPVGGTIRINELISAILNDDDTRTTDLLDIDAISGVPVVYIGEKTVYGNPGALSATQAANITVARGRLPLIEDPTLDILVNLTVV